MYGPGLDRFVRSPPGQRGLAPIIRCSPVQSAPPDAGRWTFISHHGPRGSCLEKFNSGKSLRASPVVESVTTEALKRHVDTLNAGLQARQGKVLTAFHILSEERRDGAFYRSSRYEGGPGRDLRTDRWARKKPSVTLYANRDGWRSR